MPDALSYVLLKEFFDPELYSIISEKEKNSYLYVDSMFTQMVVGYPLSSPTVDLSSQKFYGKGEAAPYGLSEELGAPIVDKEIVKTFTI